MSRHCTNRNDSADTQNCQDCSNYCNYYTRLTGLFPGTTQVSGYHKGKTNLGFTEARDSEWQWHQLGHMQVCNSLQTDNHASIPPPSFVKTVVKRLEPAERVD